MVSILEIRIEFVAHLLDALLGGTKSVGTCCCFSVFIAQIEWENVEGPPGKEERRISSVHGTIDPHIPQGERGRCAVAKS